MGFVLICSGIWNLIFAFSKWSLEAQSQLLKVLCILNGFYLASIGISGMFYVLNTQQVFVVFSLSLLVVGALMDHKYHSEKNKIAKWAIVSAFLLVILGIGIVLFSNDVNDRVYGCASLTGCIMILSTPFSALNERMNKDPQN